jgi:hypothetical protein
MVFHFELEGGDGHRLEFQVLVSFLLEKDPFASIGQFQKKIGGIWHPQRFSMR